MIEFIRRHILAVTIAGVGLGVVVFLNASLEGFQVGIGPEFLLKVFAKLVYVGAALILTHIVIKSLFPTIYRYSYTKAGEQRSLFMIDWDKSAGPSRFNPKIYVAALVHLGVFGSVCLLLALAF